MSIQSNIIINGGVIWGKPRDRLALLKDTWVKALIFAGT